jgi:hypothetical protein
MESNNFITSVVATALSHFGITTINRPFDIPDSVNAIAPTKHTIQVQK